MAGNATITKLKKQFLGWAARIKWEVLGEHEAESGSQYLRLCHESFVEEDDDDDMPKTITIRISDHSSGHGIRSNRDSFDLSIDPGSGVSVAWAVGELAILSGQSLPSGIKGLLTKQGKMEEFNDSIDVIKELTGCGGVTL